MSTVVIEKGHPDWEVLFSVWKEQGMPGWLSSPSGLTYRVLQPSDGVVKFAPKGAFDELYGSNSGPIGGQADSTKGVNRGKK